ncbi:MAG TPA: transketolase [Thermoanaerobaculia bacterium]|nr:transketolase [Thermoanaerobaculia bacterium]
MSPDALRRLAANTLRTLAMDGVQKANSGHPGMPMGMADVATVLFTEFLKFSPKGPSWLDRDRFVLSAGHGSMLLYGLLHLSGYDLALDDLKSFRQWGSRTPGHPEHGLTPGVEVTTGPLGQGVSTAVGLALAERMLAARFNRPGHEIVDHFTYAIASDGDLMEGVSHEACALAAHLGLGRLVVLYDDNGISIDGPTSLSFSEDVPARFAAYGWHVARVDGHDPDAVTAAIAAAKAEGARPSLIACRTHIGFGSPNRQDTSKAHGEPLGADEIRLTKEKLGWPVDAQFLVPEEVRDLFGDAAARGAKAEADWNARLAAYRTAHPDLAKELDLFLDGKLPDGWGAKLPAFPAEKPLATRQASGAVLDALVPAIPTLVGGSADLTPSNNTRAKTALDVKPAEYAGSYLRFGIREHGMGAILNGLALHGFRPFGGTFLVFADYMKGAIRLASLMEQPVVYVFTHDSIGLGEDGPTHQPIEQLASLRATPGLVVYRPADANETAAGWRVALSRTHGPTALALTRQGLPVLPPNDGALRGGYVVADADGFRAILIGSGSELHLALAAQKLLAASGIPTRVVSMPSIELFLSQDEAWRESVLPRACRARVAVEAGATLTWGGIVGLDGAVVGLDRFGASAPYQTLYEKLGLTAEAVAAAAQKLL